MPVSIEVADRVLPLCVAPDGGNGQPQPAPESAGSDVSSSEPTAIGSCSGSDLGTNAAVRLRPRPRPGG